MVTNGLRINILLFTVMQHAADPIVHLLRVIAVTASSIHELIDPSVAATVFAHYLHVDDDGEVPGGDLPGRCQTREGISDNCLGAATHLEYTFTGCPYSVLGSIRSLYTETFLQMVGHRRMGDKASLYGIEVDTLTRETISHTDFHTSTDVIIREESIDILYFPVEWAFSS